MLGTTEIPVWVFVVAGVGLLIILVGTGQESQLPDGSGGS